MILFVSTLRHPNVILFIGANVTKDFVYIVTEFCSNGRYLSCFANSSLYDIIHNLKIQLTFEKQLQMAIDAARGMLYLHEREPTVIHRDLKSSNLLVDKDWNVKVADFGLSTIFDNQRNMTGNTGTGILFL